MSENGLNNSDAKVPMSVLDRFLKMSSKSNDAYSSVIAAMDTMSTNMMEVSDRLETLEKTIENEKLAKVMSECSNTIKGDVASVREAMKGMGSNKYNIMLGISEYLEYNNIDIKPLAKSVIWLFSIAAFVRGNLVKFAFITGMLLVYFFGTNLISAWDVLKLFLK